MRTWKTPSWTPCARAIKRRKTEESCVFRLFRKRRPKCTALVPAAGSARRMDGANKVFLSLCGVPVLVRTLTSLQLARRVDGIIVAARERDIDESLFKAILRKLDFSRVQFEKDMADFSAGQKKKVLIAASLCEKAHLHVWDEPMNYIDLYSRMQLEELILRCAPTLLFVEHDRAFCERVATATVTI